MCETGAYAPRVGHEEPAFRSEWYLGIKRMPGTMV